jgi:hypothetical protein
MRNRVQRNRVQAIVTTLSVKQYVYMSGILSPVIGGCLSPHGSVLIPRALPQRQHAESRWIGCDVSDVGNR